MDNIAKVKIEIEGQEIKTPYSRILINQNMDWHHTFEIRFPITNNEKIKISDHIGQHIGKSIKVKIQSENAKANEGVSFTGFITGNSVDYSGTNSDIVIEGYSPTILLDDGIHFRSFASMKLSDIVSKILMETPLNIKTSVNSHFPGKFDYFVQYKETSYNFLRRIAEKYGDWFYFDGTQLNYGDLQQNNSIDAQYYDFIDLKIEQVLFPVKMKEKTYNYSKSNTYAASPGGSVSGLDSFGKKALSESDNLFSRETLDINSEFVEAADLEKLVTARKSGIAGNMIMLSGSSFNKNISIGTKLDVKDYGNFLVIEVIHSCDGIGNYQNHFKAIPASLTMPPYFPHRAAQHPVCDVHNASVTANNDPDKLGRVKVNLFWDDNPQSTWIRVLSASSGDKRGTYFVPEVGDDVLVAFEDNNPSKPYVIGSVYNKTAPPYWDNNGNYLKGIKTISDNEILFNDEGGKETITIQQKGKNNEIVISLEGDGKISFTTKGEMIFKADKSISFESHEQITMKADKGASFESQQGIKITATQDLEMKGMNVKVNADAGIELKATADAKLEGLNTTVQGSVGAKVTGSATAEISSTGQTTVKGSIVMIN